ncbi:hypothetical protein Tco_0779240 [Tanacetum coccineum]
MRQSRWMKLFSEFDFEVKYHLGKANVDVVPWSMKKGEAKNEFEIDVRRSDLDVAWLGPTSVKRDGEWLILVGQGLASIWRDVKTSAIEEAYTTKYPIHPGADATYFSLRWGLSFEYGCASFEAWCGKDVGYRFIGVLERGTAEFMDREVKSLKRSKIVLVQFRWDSKRGPEFTWERKDRMRSKCP